jgi:hypothetical protein
MNGRVYDPYVARFLSPDPIIQNAENSQNHNRYSYCINNPLKYTDPSGYSYESESPSRVFLNMITMLPRVLTAGFEWINDQINNSPNPHGYFTADYICNGVMPGPGNTFYLANKGTDYSFRSWPVGVGGFIPSDGEHLIGSGSHSGQISYVYRVITYQVIEEGDFNNLDLSMELDYNSSLETPGMSFRTHEDEDGDETKEEKKAQDGVVNNINFTSMLEEAIPVAISFEGSFSGECGYGSSGTPYGGIIIFRGNDAWSYTSFSAANLGVGWFGVSATTSQTSYFYIGELDNFGIHSFSGTSYQVQMSGGEIVIGGGHINVVIDRFGGVLFGIGPDIGLGVGSPISGQGTWQKTKLH